MIPRTANLPRGGESVYASTHMSFEGTTSFTTATLEVLRGSVCPVRLHTCTEGKTTLSIERAESRREEKEG